MVSEYVAATGLVAWCRRNDVIIFRVPNRSYSPRDWAKQCAEGAEKGCPDYIFCMPDGRYIAWELKTRTGKRSKEQVLFGDRLVERWALYGFGTWRDAIKRMLELMDASTTDAR